MHAYDRWVVRRALHKGRRIAWARNLTSRRPSVILKLSKEPADANKRYVMAYGWLCLVKRCTG